jgi:hypothetical protein
MGVKFMKKTFITLMLMVVLILSFSAHTFAAKDDSYTTFVFDPAFSSNNVLLFGSGKITKVEVLDSSKTVHATWGGIASLTGVPSTSFQWDRLQGSYYSYFTMKYVRIWYDSTAVPSITRASLLQSQTNAMDTNTISDSYTTPTPTPPKTPDLSLVRGGNTVVQKIMVINYDEPRKVNSSDLLPYSYSKVTSM